jgi:integrase
MGVRLKKVHGAWYLYVNHQGKRKCKKIGLDRRIAETVRRQVEAKLALGDLAIFGCIDAVPNTPTFPTFGTYADHWLKAYARVECKRSTSEGYAGILRNYLRPRFATIPLNKVKRDQIKVMIAEMIDSDLSRSTIKNAISVIRSMFNQAIEDRLLESNPAGTSGPQDAGCKAGG